jgi:hypothetical protein
LKNSGKKSIEFKIINKREANFGKAHRVRFFVLAGPIPNPVDPTKVISIFVENYIKVALTLAGTTGLGIWSYRAQVC